MSRTLTYTIDVEEDGVEDKKLMNFLNTLDNIEVNTAYEFDDESDDE